MIIGNGVDGSGRQAWLSAGQSGTTVLTAGAAQGQQFWDLADGAGWAVGDLVFIADENAVPLPGAPATGGAQIECLGPVVEVDGATVGTAYGALRDRLAGASVWRPCRWASLPPGPTEWVKRRDAGMEQVATLDGQTRNLQTRDPGMTICLRHARVALPVWRGVMDFLRAADGAAWGAGDFALSGWDREARRWAVDHVRLVSDMPAFRELALGWPGLEMDLQVVALDAWPDGGTP